MSNLKLRKISLAVCLATGSISVPSHADEILFPQVISSNSVTTLLSVVNSGNTDSLHYRFYYKTSENRDPCEEVNFTQPSSPNDLVTFDVSGKFGNSQGVLFEPNSSISYRNFSVFKSVKPTRAFAIVDNNGGTLQSDQSLTGEALVVDFVNGAIWGYSAYNALPIYGVTSNGSKVVGNEFDFSDRVERFGEVLTPSSSGVPISVLPFDNNEVDTALLVTPIATQPPFQLSLDTVTTVGLAIPEIEGVMFDRDENPFSGSQSQKVTCVGRVNIGTLMSEATKQYLETNGGWTTVKPLEGQAVVFKLEYSDSPNLDNNSLGVGSVNNTLWLREGNRESLNKSTLPGTRLTFNPTFYTPEESPYPLVDIAKALSYNLPWPPTNTVLPMSYVDKGAYFSVTTSKQ